MGSKNSGPLGLDNFPGGRLLRSMLRVWEGNLLRYRYCRDARRRDVCLNSFVSICGSVGNRVSPKKLKVPNQANGREPRKRWLSSWLPFQPLPTNSCPPKEHHQSPRCKDQFGSAGILAVPRVACSQSNGGLLPLETRVLCFSHLTSRFGRREIKGNQTGSVQAVVGTRMRSCKLT